MSWKVPLRHYLPADTTIITGDNRMIRSFAAIAGLLTALAVQAHGPAVSRYRVTEVIPPASATQDCLAGYTRGATINTINDFGVVNGTVQCYSQVDVAANILQFNTATFVAATWFGAIELPQSVPGFTFSYTLNNRGEAFGYEAPFETGGLYGTKWSLAGGRERIFDDPACESIRFSGAVDGNARYTVGWALRPDPIFLPFVLCIQNRWVIRDSAGVVTDGPLGGAPYALNAFDVAVGTSNGSAIRYHLPTAQTRVLHAADSAHSAEATSINDLGEMAGRVTTNSRPDQFNQCDPGVAVRWDRHGREQVLPHLPGAVSSHAFGVGYDGEVVGDSGAGQYCPYYDNSGERALLWKDGRAWDLNSLIPKSAGITLTYAYSVNRRGQITASGYDNEEPLTQCAQSQADPDTGMVVVTVSPCHSTRTYVLTPVGNR
jgi:hypothetical protein